MNREEEKYIHVCTRTESQIAYSQQHDKIYEKYTIVSLNILCIVISLNIHNTEKAIDTTVLYSVLGKHPQAPTAG